jgi:hypothetical protein
MSHLSSVALFLLAGLSVYFVSALWIVILAFRANFFLGCVCAIFPIAQLIYAALNWKETRWPFCLQLGGMGLILLTVFVGIQTGQLHPVHSQF